MATSGRTQRRVGRPNKGPRKLIAGNLSQIVADALWDEVEDNGATMTDVVADMACHRVGKPELSPLNKKNRAATPGHTLRRSSSAGRRSLLIGGNVPQIVADALWSEVRSLDATMTDVVADMACHRVGKPELSPLNKKNGSQGVFVEVA